MCPPVQRGGEHAQQPPRGRVVHRHLAVGPPHRQLAVPHGETGSGAPAAPGHPTAGGARGLVPHRQLAVLRPARHQGALRH
eukprot:5272765-Pyramimonas_sp.AAC.1